MKIPTPDELHASYPEIKYYVIESLFRYLYDRIPPGDFLMAVLQNNLKESFKRADLYNRENLFYIVNMLYNEFPIICWGSPEKVEAWLRRENIFA